MPLSELKSGRISFANSFALSMTAVEAAALMLFHICEDFPFKAPVRCDREMLVTNEVSIPAPKASASICSRPPFNIEPPVHGVLYLLLQFVDVAAEFVTRFLDMFFYLACRFTHCMFSFKVLTVFWGMWICLMRLLPRITSTVVRVVRASATISADSQGASATSKPNMVVRSRNPSA